MPDEAYCDWKGWKPGDFGRLSADQHTFYEHDIKPRLPQVEAPLELLELGFGNGAFTSWCRLQGLQYSGLETNPALLQRAKQAGVCVAERLAALQLRPGALHAVVAIDVLEHLPPQDSMALLRELRPLMHPQGRFIARFPNGDSPFSMPYQNGDFTHLTAIGSRMLQQIADQSGWRLLSFQAPTVPPTAPGLRAALVRRAGLLLRRLMDRLVSRLYLSGQPVVLAPNALAVLCPLPLTVEQEAP